MVMRCPAACAALLVSMFHALPAAAQVVEGASRAADVTPVETASLRRAVDRHVSELLLTAAKSTVLPARRQQVTKRGWIKRHPALFGAAVGFWTGFFIGYLPGDDGVFDDFTATFNGMVVGGIGAGVGAVTGAVVSAASR